jgi:hypothetical protein
MTYCCLDADYAKEIEFLKQEVDAGAGKHSNKLNHQSRKWNDAWILLLLWD